MEFIIANIQGVEIGFMDKKSSFDLDVGDTNDFELTLYLPYLDEETHAIGNWLYAIDTEYGGIIQNFLIDTKLNKITLSGDTWRGMLAKKIISPASGQDYRIVTGDANTVIDSLISTAFGGLFVADTTLSGITINYQFLRYCTMLDGFTAMLAEHNARLDIKAEYNPSDGRLQIVLSAVPIIDYSNTLEISQDSGIYFTIEKKGNGINHLICLGSGELSARTVVHLYTDEFDKITTTQTYFNVNERVAIFDYSSAEDSTALTEAGKKEFANIKPSSTQKMTTNDSMDMEMYDIVGGRERITGTVITQPVTGKIVNVDDGIATTKYKLGGKTI